MIIRLVSFFLFSGFLFAEDPWSISRDYPVTQEVLQIHSEHEDVKENSLLSFWFRFYKQYISEMDGQSCHYYPSCSVYAMDAVNEYGVIQGALMASDRLMRCHPGQKEHFYDPVPTCDCNASRRSTHKESFYDPLPAR